VIVATHQDVLATWLCKRIGLVPTPHLRCFGVVHDNQLVAVVGFDSWNGASCQMHVAGEGGHWMSRELLRAVFHYAFVASGLQVVLGVVPSGNTAALKLNKHLGFTEDARINNAHPDGALVIMSMRREYCRWLKEKNLGQEVSTPADHA
jgi:RimJ/RimL family protein N-acetyltransferase